MSLPRNVSGRSRRVSLAGRALAPAVAAALLVATPVRAQVVSVLDSNTGTLGLSFQDLAINAAGVLAFDASTDTTNQRGVFTFDPGTSTLTNVALATTNSTNNTVIRDITQVRINASGTVGFQVTFGGSTASARPQGVFTGTGSGTVLVIKSGATTSVNAPVPLNNTLSFFGIDDTGRSVLSGRSSGSPDRRYVLSGDGSAVASVVLDNVTSYAGVQGSGFYSFGSGVVRDDGQKVAFGAIHLPGPTFGDSGAYLLDTTSGSITTIEDEDSDPLFSFVAAPTGFLSDGDVVYQVTAGGNQLREFRRYDVATGTISKILDNNGDIGVPSSVQVNASGQLAYVAILDATGISNPLGPTGVYAGLDPIADEVAVPGASLLGGKVVSANNAVQLANGDIYFAYTLDTDNNGTADVGGVARSGRPTINRWNAAGGGDFLSAGNWSDGVAPNGVGVRAKLGDAISAPAAVNVNAAVTLDALSIEDADGYTISGSGSLTFDGPRYHVIGVRAGRHAINVPVTVSKPSGAINVDGTGSELSINAPLTFTNPDAYFRKNGTGTLVVPNVRAGALDLGSGVVQVAPNGANGGLSVVKHLVTSNVVPSTGDAFYTGSLDLTDNAMIVDYPTGDSPLAVITQAVASGYNGGAWTGTGVTSSTAAGNGVTAVGVAEASALGITTFFGESVDADAVLLRYTRQGDANLDGTTGIGDFSILAGNFNAVDSAWSRGDFNFDGVTGIADFSLLAANFNQSAPTGTGGRGVVPEPGAVAGVLLGVALLARRRSTVGAC